MGYPLDFMDDDCDIEGFPLEGIRGEGKGLGRVTHAELKKAALPLVELLTKHCSPESYVVVREAWVELVQTIMGVSPSDEEPIWVPASPGKEAEGVLVCLQRVRDYVLETYTGFDQPIAVMLCNNLEELEDHVIWSKQE